RERTRAVPGGADHDTERGKLVFGLNDGVAVLAGFRINAIATAMSDEGLGKRGGGRDRIPGAHCRTTVERAECRRRVAFDIDALADRVRAPDLESDRAGKMRERIIAANTQRLDVRRDQLVLALEFLADQLFGNLHVEVE